MEAKIPEQCVGRCPIPKYGLYALTAAGLNLGRNCRGPRIAGVESDDVVGDVQLGFGDPASAEVIVPVEVNIGDSLCSNSLLVRGVKQHDSALEN